MDSPRESGRTDRLSWSGRGPLSKKMKCLECAECCRLLKVSVALDEKLSEWFSAHFGREIKQVSFRIRHDCIQLKEGRCMIYDGRPEVCKDHFCNKDSEKLLELDFNTREEDI